MERSNAPGYILDRLLSKRGRTPFLASPGPGEKVHTSIRRKRIRRARHLKETGGDFVKHAESLGAVAEKVIGIEEFDTYGATVCTLRGFISSYHELIRVIREDYMLPNPDVK